MAKRGRQAVWHDEDEDEGRRRRVKTDPVPKQANSDNQVIKIFKMPIVNGTYVFDTLPAVISGRNSSWINQAFGDEYKSSSRDWSDDRTAAYNYLMKQQEQAYNLELWNLQNQYNTPQAMMQRYQDANLNPNLIYSKDNMSSAPASASANPFRSGGTYARNMQNAISTIGQIMNVVKAASETYDYMKYGREISAWNRNLLIQRGQAQANENLWQDYLLGRLHPEAAEAVAGSPKGRMYSFQTDTQEQKYLQLRAVVGMIPDQAARTRALKALDDYRLQILQGQYGAIMSINTGSQPVDSFLQMLGFYLLGK